MLYQSMVENALRDLATIKARLESDQRCALQCATAAYQSIKAAHESVEIGSNIGLQLARVEGQMDALLRHIKGAYKVQSTAGLIDMLVEELTGLARK